LGWDRDRALWDVAEADVVELQIAMYGAKQGKRIDWRPVNPTARALEILTSWRRCEQS
jgi:hypothetical protein